MCLCVHVCTCARGCTLTLKGIDAALNLGHISFFLGVYCCAWLYTDGSTEQSQCQGKEKGLLSEVKVKRKLCHYLSPLCGDI